MKEEKGEEGKHRAETRTKQNKITMFCKGVMRDDYIRAEAAPVLFTMRGGNELLVVYSSCVLVRMLWRVFTSHGHNLCFLISYGYRVLGCFTMASVASVVLLKCR